MRVLVTGRREGKTTRLMQQALEFAKRFPTVVVVHDEKAAAQLRDLYARDILGSKLEIFGFQRLLMNPKKVYHRMLIDDAELILSMILGPHVDRTDGRLTTISMTGVPMADLEAAKAGAVMLWREAAKMARDAGAVVATDSLAAAYDKRAKELEDQLPGIWKLRLNPDMKPEDLIQPNPDNVTELKQKQ